jgi:hypothetical protein
MSLTREELRLRESDQRVVHWKRWGPYLSERAWGTVREDYSPYGTAWDYLPHDHARSRAYRWNEDGLAGVCDRHQKVCFALALWNGRDPILKERLFGLTGAEGNHGEDVKEYYFYLDSTPTHSYMKYLYKYPQAKFPYELLVAENQSRGRKEPEYELMDTGVFDGDRYFDVFRGVRKRDSGGAVSPDHGCESRAGSRGAPLATHALVSQHVVVGAGGRTSPSCGSCLETGASSSSTSPRSAGDGCTAEALPSCFSPRTTPIRGGSSATPTARCIRKTGSTTTSSGARPA